jgi:release factor glutamine methyltransferase
MHKEKQIITFIKEIEQSLQTIYTDAILCRQYAWWILEAITQKKKVDLIAQNILILHEQEYTKIEQWIKKIVHEHMPLQYLLGFVPFNDVEILVEPHILIPRPETEEWCLKVIQQLKQLKNQRITILDICTGSGCVALALAKALSRAIIYASDISEHAIKLVRKNVRHNALSNVIPIKSDLFKNLPTCTTFDLIVSNPPYIALAEWKYLDESVTQWEAKHALVADDHGLEFIKKIIDQTPYFLKFNQELQEKRIANLVLEIGYKQADAVTQLMKQAHYKHIKIDKDLEGKDRVAYGSTVPCDSCRP